jgi:hypothetical protein
MDEPKYELPAWLPWATTACLAALVACLGELWIIERSRSVLLREQVQLAEAAVKAAQNQLEAERILDARQIQNLGANAGPGGALQVAVLLPSAPGSPAVGVAVIDPASGRGQLRLFGGFAQPDARDYQLWIDGAGPGHPSRCAVFHVAQGGDTGAFPISVPAMDAGSRLVLIDGERGGSSSLGQAEASGPIILASAPTSGRISGR